MGRSRDIGNIEGGGNDQLFAADQRHCRLGHRLGYAESLERLPVPPVEWSGQQAELSAANLVGEHPRAENAVRHPMPIRAQAGMVEQQMPSGDLDRIFEGFGGHPRMVIHGDDARQDREVRRMPLGRPAGLEVDGAVGIEHDAPGRHHVTVGHAQESERRRRIGAVTQPLGNRLAIEAVARRAIERRHEVVRLFAAGLPESGGTARIDQRGPAHPRGARVIRRHHSQRYTRHGVGPDSLNTMAVFCRLTMSSPRC
jgi:hypothetical protein